MNLGNIQSQAQGMIQRPPQGAGPALPPRPPSPITPPGTPEAGLPPTPVLLQLAQEAQALPPIVLGTIMFDALKQHGLSANQQGINSLGQ